MTRIGKCLVVFVLFASVAFMGAAIVTVFAGPNFRAHADELSKIRGGELGDFTFVAPATPQGTWTVKTRGVNEETVGSFKILPEAIFAAQKKKAANLTAEKQVLDQQRPVVEAKIKEADALVALDKAAMKRRQDALERERLAVAARVSEVSAQASAKSKEASDQYALAKLRRQEWILMNNQLQEIRSQKIAALEESRRLQDLLIQAQGNLERAKRRQQLLQQDGARVEDY